ncbi:hypothetical protein GQX74_000470 [Glossina fuscipes]|nr:hypothetical protein GQX74_000470 [Glossina fuscipes]
MDGLSASEKLNSRHLIREKILIKKIRKKQKLAKVSKISNALQRKAKRKPITNFVELDLAVAVEATAVCCRKSKPFSKLDAEFKRPLAAAIPPIAAPIPPLAPTIAVTVTPVGILAFALIFDDIDVVAAVASEAAVAADATDVPTVNVVTVVCGLQFAVNAEEVCVVILLPLLLLETVKVFDHHIKIILKLENKEHE